MICTTNWTQPRKKGSGSAGLGLYDGAIYEQLLEIQELTKLLESTKAEVRALGRLFEELDIEADLKKIENLEGKANDRFREIEERIRELENEQAEDDINTPEIKEVSGKVSKLKSDFAASLEIQSEQLFEIEDSKLFINELNLRLESVEDAIVARKALGDIKLETCPQCLNPLEIVPDLDSCPLCKSSIDGKAGSSTALRMKNELELQLRESNQLLERLEQAVKKRRTTTNSLRRNLAQGQNELNQLLAKQKSSRDLQLDDLYQKKGKLEGDLEGLQRAKTSISVLEARKSDVKNLTNQIGGLKQSVAEARKAQEVKRSKVARKVSDIAVYILQNDVSVEDAFEVAENVTLDWKGNTFAVDGRNNFSASSVVYLRNAVHLALFFASLEVDFMRYPRFIILDNIEDKGMVEARSRNFQRTVVKLAAESDVEHQIIFTTSMIDPTLNDTKQCVGPFYRDGVKTLNL